MPGVKPNRFDTCQLTLIHTIIFVVFGAIEKRHNFPIFSDDVN